MAYRVVLADSAKADANAIYERVIAEAPIRGPEWFLQLMECLHSIDHLPDRCPRAREAEQASVIFGAFCSEGAATSTGFSMK